MGTGIIEIKPPGVYNEKSEERYMPISLGKSGIAGFIGLAEKGQTNKPVKITDYNQYREIFGDLKLGTYMDHAVEGFFMNGGKECYVLRIAHIFEKARGEVAKKASIRLKDRASKNIILVNATSEGIWGNEIKISIKQELPKVQTFLTLDLHQGETSATIKSTYGFRRGTLLKIYDSEKLEYRVCQEVTGKNIVWSEPIKSDFLSSAPTYIEPVTFQIRTWTTSKSEYYKNLSLSPQSEDYFIKAVNSRSTLIYLVNLGLTSPMPDCFPEDVEETKLSGGSDGLFNVTPDDFIGMHLGFDERYGLTAYEAVEDVDIIAAPDLMWVYGRSTGFTTHKDIEVVQHAMVEQCERLKDRIALLEFPDPSSISLATQWRLMFDSAFAAFYFPWLVVEKNEERIPIPPSGHIAGIIARCDEQMGLNRPPANEVIEGHLDLALILREEDIGFLNREGINCLKSFPTKGIRIWGARTTSSDPQLKYLNVRRILNGIIKAVSLNLQWAVFEPNTPRIWKTISREVSFFMLKLWEKGFFKGSSPEEAFYVKCDHETNPAEMINSGFLTVEVGVAPVRPTEYIAFRLTQEMQTTSENQ